MHVRIALGVSWAMAVLFASACGSVGETGPALSTATSAAAVSPVPLTQPPQPIANPPFPRALAGMAYDPLAAETVMFGGLSNDGPLPDTWIWDGRRWSQTHPSVAPHRRYSAAMAFDPQLGGVVLIGGNPDGPTNESVDADMRATWLWRSSEWQRLSTSHTPVPENYSFGWHSLMAYDGKAHELVLVSVQGGPHEGPCTAETWTFDGSDWRRRTPAEALPATVRVLVSDGPTGQVLAVVNPRAALRPQGFFMPMCAAGSHDARALSTSTTFGWTGSTWAQLSGAQPPAAGNDGDAGGTMLGGHAVLVEDNATVWWWSGSGWVERAMTPSPPPRSLSELGQDRNGRLVMFGGILQSPPWYLGDTWLSDGSRWVEVPETGQPASASR